MDGATPLDTGLFEDYQRELEALETFREGYRHLYPFAGLERADPDVQRLVEALAFFTARTRRAADHALASYERRALEQVFPHLCTPMPAAALLAVDGAERMAEARRLPAGTEVVVTSAAPAPVLCRTARELTVRPWDLDRARVELVRRGEEGWELVLPIASAAPRVEAVEEIELHLDPRGDLLAALRLHHGLARHLEEVHYAFPGTRQPARRARQVAFTPAPSAEEELENPLERFRALVHFPLAALVVRVRVDETPAEWRRLELRLRLGPGWPPELSVPPGALLLHAVPIVNLRRSLADPVALDGTRARFLVAHPEPGLGLRVRELAGVYRSVGAALAPILPQALAAGDADWFTVETAGLGKDRRTWLDVHAPDAFEARAAVVADAEWYQPDAGRILRGPGEARPGDRQLEGARVRVVTPVADAAESPLAGDRERLARLLALSGSGDVDAPALRFLLEMLGAASDERFGRVAAAIAEVRTTRRPDARSPSGERADVEVLLRRLPLALVPAAALLLSRLPALLAAWSGEAPPVVTVKREGDAAITYGDGGGPHGG